MRFSSHCISVIRSTTESPPTKRSLILSLTVTQSLSVTPLVPRDATLLRKSLSNDATCNGLDESRLAAAGGRQLWRSSLKLDTITRDCRYCLFYCCNATYLNLKYFWRIRYHFVTWDIHLNHRLGSCLENCPCYFLSTVYCKIFRWF